MARYFNYLYNNNEFNDAYLICQKIVKDILEFDLDLLDVNDKKIVLNFRKEIEEIKKDNTFSRIEILRKITSELLAPENVEYAMIHQKYPNGASKTGEMVSQTFKKIFDMEDKMQIIVSKLWRKIITPFDKIKNGEEIILIGHSGYGYINLPMSKYYQNNEYNNITSYSCSIFTNGAMNEYNSKVIMLFDVNENSFICANSFDSATKSSSKIQDVQTLKTNKEGYSIRAGHTYTSDISKVITKSECPTTTLAKVKKNNKNINEVILDKQNSVPTGLVLLSDGSDFLFFEYLDILKMKKDYNLDFKVINKTLYVDMPITINACNQKLRQFEYYILSLDKPYEELCNLLDSYITDVIIPLKLDSQVEKMQLEFIDYIKEKLKTYKY